MTDQPMSPDRPPAEVSHLVRERVEARAARDWARADALKARIEAAGWKLVDHGARTTVVRAAPTDVEVAGERRYGSAASVPSRLEEPASAAFTVVVHASEEPLRLARLLDGLRATAPAGTQVVIVANDPSAAQEAALAPGSEMLAASGGFDAELLRTAVRLGHAAALNVGLRRAAGSVVVLADGSAWPHADALSPLADALADPDVGVAGGFGVVSTDPDRLSPSALVRSELGDTLAVEGAWLAFRRSDYAALGPLDEHFVTPGWLDVWWSLRLRAGADPDAEDPDDAPAAEAGEAGNAPPPRERAGDGGPGSGGEFDPASVPEKAEAGQASDAVSGPVELRPPRRAVRLDLPLDHDETDWPPERTRLNRRNMYRVVDAFGWRRDLLEGTAAERREPDPQAS